MTFTDAIALTIGLTEKNMVVPGVVGAVRSAGSGTRQLYDVNGVPMPSLVEGLQPGDFVAVLAQADPIILGRFVGDGGGVVVPPVVVPPDPTGVRPRYAAPPIPVFNESGAVQVRAQDDMRALMASNPEGTHFRMLPGQHRLDNVRVKRNSHIRFDPRSGSVKPGGGSGFCFRPENENSDNVAIGGVGDERPEISGYGDGTRSAGVQGRTAAIQGQLDDTLAGEHGQFIYDYVSSWMIYGLAVANNDGTGIFLGDYWDVYDCLIEENAVTGVAANRAVGSLLKDCEFWHNGTVTAAGNLSNGGQMKTTWHNGAIGRTGPTGTNLPKSEYAISTCTFMGRSRSGSTTVFPNHAVWFDLDCQQGFVEHSIFDGHRNTSIFWEGCNNGEAAYNRVRNCDGHFGYGQDFASGALCSGESTNIWFHHNIIEDCERAMMNRLSNRSVDWLSLSEEFVNYAVPPSDGGRRFWLSPDAVPIPGVGDQSNIWTGANRYTDNQLIRCGQVQINEGTDNDRQKVRDATDLSSIEFSGNDYSQSPGIEFFNRSATPLTLQQWQTAGND